MTTADDIARLELKVDQIEQTVQGMQISFATAATEAKGNAAASKERHDAILAAIADMRKIADEKAKADEGAIRVPARYFWGFVALLLAAAGLTQAGAIVMDRTLNAPAHAAPGVAPEP